MTTALCREMELQKDYLGKHSHSDPLETIYFGGGTPSALSTKNISKIFEAIYKNFNVSDNAEITLESNPDDMTEMKLSDLRKTPINRISMGVQSFYDDDLKLMNRSHDAKTAISSVERTFSAGFDNITIDLIYGVPGMNDQTWSNNLKVAFELPVNHLSCYGLTIENKIGRAHV